MLPLVLEIIHRFWFENCGTQKHPLAPLVRAWQNRPKKSRASLRPDPVLPVLQSVSIPERKQAQRMLGLIPDPKPNEAQIQLFPDLNYPDLSRRVSLLALTDASGVPVMTQGRGAALDLRLTVESLLSIDLDDRELNRRLNLAFTVRELRDGLFPNGWERRRDWPRVREALLRSNLRGIPIDERGSTWHPLHVYLLPSLYSMMLDDKILIEVRSPPPGSKSGPIIDRPVLWPLGVESSPRYRAYIGVQSLAWKPGKTRVVNLKRKRYGWAGNPNVYPVITQRDRRAIAFGPNDRKNRTHDEIDKAFTDLPGVVVLDQYAVDQKTNARGWRMLPEDAAIAVQAWRERQKEHANRGNGTR